MDLTTFHWLLTEAGQALLAEAETADLSDTAQLRELERLRRMASPEQAAAAYEMARLRRRGTAKFSQAHRMYFTREALEQASGELVATYRATRYAQLSGTIQVADLCCGIGGDTLALTRHVRVIGIDQDALRLVMAQANATTLGQADRATFRALDLEREPPPSADALFFDPARRSDGRRTFKLAEYRPPVQLVNQWRHTMPAIGVKLAPGVADEELEPFGPAELEFLSVDGELKEAALWLGPLAEPGKRATVIARPKTQGPRPKTQEFENHQSVMTNGFHNDLLTTHYSQDEFQARGTHATRNAKHDTSPISNLQITSLFSPRGEEVARAPVAEPGAFLYEPDPAVIRAGLVGPLALQLGAAQVDPEIAYLTADSSIATPLARCWRVLEWIPFQLKRLRARLRALDAGAVTVKKRGSPLETDALARQLSGAGSRPLVVALTFVGGKPAALICEGPVEVDDGR
jgi:hypothetical protein